MLSGRREGIGGACAMECREESHMANRRRTCYWHTLAPGYIADSAGGQGCDADSAGEQGWDADSGVGSIGGWDCGFDWGCVSADGVG